MSISYSVYIGPYIHCQNGTTQRPEFSWGCPKCRKDVKTEFCSKCGSATERLETMAIDKTVRWHDREDAFEKIGISEDDLIHIQDYGIPSDEDIFIRNNGDGPGHFIDIDDDFGIVVNEEDINPSMEKLTMQNLYKDHIKVFRELYGAENVEIRWGGISYTR